MSKLRIASRPSATGKGPRATVAAPEWTWVANDTALSFRQKGIDDTLIARSHAGALNDLSLSESFVILGPASMVRSHPQVKPSGESMSRLLNIASQRNKPRLIHSPPRSVDSGGHRWASFRDFAGRAYSPTRSHRVLQWRPLVNPSRTVAIYLDRLGKACQMRNIPPSRFTADISGVDRASRTLVIYGASFVNCIPSKNHRKKIDRESVNSERGRIGYIS